MPSSLRLLVADAGSGMFLTRVRASPATAGFELSFPEAETPEALRAAAAEADAIYCYMSRLSREVLQSARRLKFIQKHGLTCKNIDLAAAAEMGIPVATLPLMRNASVAEQALLLMLACARKLIPGYRAVAESAYKEMGVEPIQTSQWNFKGNWARIPGLTELFGATAGIIGMGDIGMEIAKRCRAFDMAVLYHQRTRHAPETETRLGMRCAPMDELLAASDFVVLIVPHTPETEGMIGEAQIARMKPTATLVNVGRGALIDEEALACALREGRLGMAGLDVYRWEPLPDASPLRTLPNVVLSPHLGGGSSRSWDVDIPAALENIRRFFRGEAPTGLVTGG